MGTETYIDFAEFCKIMATFNPKTGSEDKIKFYFRIFDVDKDNKVNESDLINVMKLLFGKRMNYDDMKTLSDKIFAEVI